jgi:hypothetical protein
MAAYANTLTIADLQIERHRLSELRREWSHIYAETDVLSSAARHGVEVTGADIRIRMEAIDAELSRRSTTKRALTDAPSLAIAS